MPRLPDWLIYLAVVVTMLIASLGRREHANAPPPPPPVPGADQAPIPPASPFAGAKLTRLPAASGSERGAAFSMSDRGVWLTARRVVAGCGAPMITLAAGWAVPARVRALSGDVAVLTTEAGAPALSLTTTGSPRPGDNGFIAGYPRGGPGEVAALFLGEEGLLGARAGRPLAWAEIGRTDGLNGPLFGLAGSPMLNADGQVIGLVLAEAPRRGRLRATTPAALHRALGAARLAPSTALPGQPMTLDNYGRVADSLRRAVSVAEVVCLAAGRPVSRRA